MLSCDQFLEQVASELDGEQVAALTEAWQQHAEACPSCAAALEFNCRLQALLRDPGLFAMPAEASERLHRALQEKLGPKTLPARLPRSRSSLLKSGLRWPPAAGRWWSYRPVWAALVILVLLGVGVFRWNAGASTISGWLVDRHCYAAYRTHAEDHPRDCLMRCAGRGYGLVDAQGRFRPFNPKGNRSARAAIASTHKLNHLWVTVLATQSSNNVLDVEHLALTAPPETPPN